MFGTLNAGASRLWKIPAEIAHMRRKTTDAPTIKLASAVAKRFAHLTDFIYDRRTTNCELGRVLGIPTLNAAETQATHNKTIAGHDLVLPHAGSTSPSSEIR